MATEGRSQGKRDVCDLQQQQQQQQQLLLLLGWRSSQVEWPVACAGCGDEDG